MADKTDTRHTNRKPPLIDNFANPVLLHGHSVKARSGPATNGVTPRVAIHATNKHATNKHATNKHATNKHATKDAR